MQATESGGGPRTRAVVMVTAAIFVVALVGGGLLVTQAAPQGLPADTGYTVWERNDDGEPVRWDPCREIVFVHNLTEGPTDVVADLRHAVARLRDVTGLDLVVAGAVDEPPHGSRSPYQPDRYGGRWAPVLVAWASPGEAGLPLRDIDRGAGIPVAVGPEGDRTYVSGQVVLNARKQDLVPGFDDRATSWGATLLHELAHVLGLGHVDEPDQLMHVHPGAGPVVLGDGDLAGLQAVGATRGCRPVPEPQPVEFAGSAPPTGGDG